METNELPEDLAPLWCLANGLTGDNANLAMRAYRAAALLHAADKALLQSCEEQLKAKDDQIAKLRFDLQVCAVDSHEENERLRGSLKDIRYILRSEEKDKVYKAAYQIDTLLTETKPE